MSLFTTRNEHAVLSFKQLMGRDDSEETDSRDGGAGGRLVPGKTPLKSTLNIKTKWGKC